MKNVVTQAAQFPRKFVRAVAALPTLLIQLAGFIPFFFLLVLLLLTEPFKRLGSSRFLAPVNKTVGVPVAVAYRRSLALLNRRKDGGMTPEDLVLLAMSHLKVKKTRSVITIGGMAIGFGSVIFLLSLGYGFQRLVVSRVATLGEMKQIDVTTGQASSLTFDSKIIDTFLALEPVDTVLPVISTVSKVNYNNSVSDVVAYGVTTKFLQESAIQPIRGEIFTDEEYISDALSGEKLSEAGSSESAVAGAAVDLIEGAGMGQELHQIRYSLYPLVWKAVYEKPSVGSKIIGYTKRIVSDQPAREVWGSVYEHAENSLSGTDDQGNLYKTWVSDTLPLWQKEACSMNNFDCVDGQYLLDRGSSGQRLTAGFITQQDMTVDRFARTLAGGSGLAEGTSLQDVRFSLPPNIWSAVYDQPKQSAISQEFSTKPESSTSVNEGELVLGEYYYDLQQWGYAGENSNSKKLGYWVKARVPVWRKLDCGADCEYYLTEQNDTQQQEIRTVYLRAADLKIEAMEFPPARTGLLTAGQVLGESTEASGSGLASASATARTASGSANASSSAMMNSVDLTALGITGSTAGLGDLDWAMIASQAGIVQVKQNKDIFPLKASARKVALVNTAMLTLLGLQPNESVGKEFDTTFLLDGRLFSKENYSAESEPTTYKIIGVLPDDKTPAFYVPIGDIKGLGIANYSQLKIIADDTSFVAKIREEAEAKGFRTSSVVDTIAGINQLFAYLRIGLLVLGLIALGVAALGMFNTLTVSLLEKTREVGLMKAMGMKSSEVQRLFIAESVIMGVSGGAFGLLFGFIAGKAVSIVLSSVSIASGSGSLDIAYIPFMLALAIMVFSFIVGVATGWYPAYRATQVSALNALRYE